METPSCCVWGLQELSEEKEEDKLGFSFFTEYSSYFLVSAALRNSSHARVAQYV